MIIVEINDVVAKLRIVGKGEEFSQDLVRIKKAIPADKRQWTHPWWIVYEPERWNLAPLKAALKDRKRQTSFL